MKAKIVLKNFKSIKFFPILLTGLILIAVPGVFGAPAGNSGSPACPFPRNVVYPHAMMPTNVSQATMNAAGANFYVYWYTNFVSGTRNQTRVLGGVSTTGTVSEGIGYGMLIAALMADKTLFDGLFGYYQADLDSNSLMNWTCTGGTGTCSGNAATDADQDVAMAL